MIRGKHDQREARRITRRITRREARKEARRDSRRDDKLDEVNIIPKDKQIFVRNEAMETEPTATNTPQPEQHKAKKKDYKLLKPIRLGKQLVEPAAAEKPPIMVRLRDDQAARLSESGHIDHAA